MVQVFDPDKQTRKMQNFAILTLLYSFSIVVFQYICSIVFLILVVDFSWVFGLFKKLSVDQDFVYHFTALYKYVSYYLQYYWAYRHVIVFDNANYLLPKMIVSLAVPNAIFVFVVFKRREEIFSYRPIKKKESIHGDAHWATEKEIRKLGLRTKEGMLIGQDKKGRIVAGGYQHTLLFAPTGSGKGVGFAIPNCLFWKESIICHDIKLENFDLCSGWRVKELKQKVYVWSPADAEGVSHCYNPMDWVSKKPGKMVDDVQKLANLLLPKREFWENEARTLGVGIMLYLCGADDQVASFGNVVRTLRNDDFAYSLAVILDTVGESLHPVAYMNLAAWLQKPDKERGSVLSTLNSGLELWANPIIDVTTSRSDFNISSFKKIPTTVFCGLTPDNIQRLKSLMSMFYQQATEFLSQKLPQKDEPYGVLFLMDEFPTLGKLEQFLAGIAYFRGYHVRLFLIIQDTQQLKGAYEDSGMNSFLSNSTYRITFAANNMDTAKLISDLIGNQTVESTSYSKPKFFDLNPSSRSQNMSGQQRALLLPQEVISLPRDDQIILIEAASPIRTKKVKYYEDSIFKKRLLPKSNVPKQKIEVARPKKSPPRPNQNEQQQEALPSGDGGS